MTEQAYGEASLEKAAGFVPLEDPNQPGDVETFDGPDAVLDAADDLARRREENQPPLIERKYIQQAGENAGEETDANRTIKIERAARDLAEIRASEAAAAEAEENQTIANVTDHVRAAILNGEYQALTGEQPPAIEPQPETPAVEQTQPGVDPEIAQALQNPKIRQALEQEVASAESYRRHYAQSTAQAAQIAAAALYSNFPELGNLTPEQLPGALQVLASQNPARFQQVRAHLDQTQSLWHASVQAQQAEQQIAAARFQQFAQQQSAVFDESIKSEPPEIVKRVKEEIVGIAERDYGLSKADFAHLYQTQPIMRSAAFQRMMFDAARFRIAQNGARETAPPTVPTVQRPGIARAAPSAGEHGVDQASRAFRANPTPKNAAALLLAKRARD